MKTKGVAMLSPRRNALLAGLAVALAVPFPAQAAPVTTTISSGDVTTPIADATWIVVGSLLSPGLTFVDLTAPELGTIVDVNLRLRASHTYVADLGVFLAGPGDTSITVVTPLNDDGGDNFGTGATSCSGTPTILDDAAAAPIASARAPFAGSFRPEEPLAAFIGKPVEGVWTLSFFDLFPGDAGVLHCWELEITYEPPPADLALRGADTPDPVKPGKRLKYTITARNDGPAAATGVTVEDTLPAGARFVSARAGQGSCSRAGRKVTCDIGDLAAGASATVTVIVTAPPRPGRLTNTASVRGAEDDPNAGNNRVRMRTTVRR
jgi:uncharacterized repeat protein (TIGR01451 family)